MVNFYCSTAVVRSAFILLRVADIIRSIPNVPGKFRQRNTKYTVTAVVVVATMAVAEITGSLQRDDTMPNSARRANTRLKACTDWLAGTSRTCEANLSIFLLGGELNGALSTFVSRHKAYCRVIAS